MISKKILKILKKIFLIGIIMLSLLLTIFIILVLYYCCPSNEFCIDLNTYELKSCSDVGIYSIYIENDSINEYCEILWEKQERAPKYINLNSVQKGYSVYLYLEGKKIDTNKLILKPNSIYKIKRHDVGDAGSFIIKIFTDSKGNIKNSDEPCN